MSPQHVWLLLRDTPTPIFDTLPDFVAVFDTSEQAVDFVSKITRSSYVEWSSDSEGLVWRSTPEEPDYTTYQIHKVRHFPKESDG